MNCNSSIGFLFYLTVDYFKVITFTVDLIWYNLSKSLLTFNANNENKYNFSWEYHGLFLPWIEINKNHNGDSRCDWK